MKFPAVLIVSGLAVAARLAAATTESMTRPEAGMPAKEVGTLLSELSDESYQVREKATRDLWEMGESALPALKEAATSTDPEQAYRARELLRKIQLHITPETDPTVISLVERYQKASITEKSILLGRMKGKRAWRQMLKLYAAETTAEAREKLKPAIAGVALRAARERLFQGDAKSAREFLEMAPADAEGLMALAEFHRSQGTLDAELNRAKSLKGRNAAPWLLALYRAAGNIPAARDAALAAGETRIAASMAVLMGDPLPWLKLMREESAEYPVSNAYLAIASRRWQGEKPRAADMETLTRALNSRDSSERGAAMGTLFLLGEAGLAEPVFMKSEPLAAFRHFDALERIPEAYTALGLDPEKPDYKPWVEKRTAKITGLDIEDQHGVSTHAEELVALANFLERRGLHDVAFEAFADPVTALSKKDAGAFLNFLGELFGNSQSLSGAPKLACRIGFAWAGDDDKRWEDLVSAAFGEDGQNGTWWDWLAELDPKASHARRFEAMLALFNVGSDPAKLRGKWLGLAWKAVENAPEDQRQSLAERISSLSNQVGDVANSLRAWELIPESARKDVFWGERIVQLSAAERWQDVADVVRDHIKTVDEARHEPSDDFHSYAYCAAALRLAGKEQEAQGYDKLADSLTLGNPGIAMALGNGYAFGRDYKRAREWWTRAATEADPSSGEYTLALKLYSDALLEDGRWKEAAATSEIVAHTFSSSDYRWSNPLPVMRQRLQADMARALAMLKDNRSAAIAILAKCHRNFASDGSLADFFFPALRKVGLIKEHDDWFNATWNKMQEIIRIYPESDNTLNTAAWFATRALRRLDEAETLLRKALAINPDQSAYLDTMAELQFARGNRDKAVEWSRRAINFAPDDMQLRRQQDRFRNDPLPK